MVFFCFNYNILKHPASGCICALKIGNYSDPDQLNCDLYVFNSTHISIRSSSWYSRGNAVMKPDYWRCFRYFCNLTETRHDRD